MAGMHGPGRHGNMGPRPKLENPGKIFTRLMKLVFADYGIHYVIVLVCIVISALTTVQGMLFMQTLIDDYKSRLILIYIIYRNTLILVLWHWPSEKSPVCSGSVFWHLMHRTELW